jgi:hypothetical protein
MKKYVITESQLKFILTEKSDKIKKGIAFKITHEEDQEPVYESKMMSFDSEIDFESFKHNLPENEEIIGIIDID